MLALGGDELHKFLVTAHPSLVVRYYFVNCLLTPLSRLSSGRMVLKLGHGTLRTSIHEAWLLWKEDEPLPTLDADDLLQRNRFSRYETQRV